MKQIVEHKKLGPVKGLLLVLSLAAVLVLLNYVAINFIAAWIGRFNARAGYIVGCLAFWGVGGAIAWQVLRVYVARVSYELGEDVLRLCRLYGKKERFIEDIYLSQLLFVGSREEAQKRYGKLPLTKALHPSSDLPVAALVYKNSAGTRMALIQADDALKAALVDRIKGRQK